MVSTSALLASAGGVAMLSVYLAGASYVSQHWSKYSPYLYEVFMMNINALVGIAAFVIYALNIGTFGVPLKDVRGVSQEGCAECVHDVPRARQLVYAYVYVSIFRFCVWYSEAVISLFFLAVYPLKKTGFIVARYATHTVNFLMSIGTLVIVSQDDFPKYELLMMQANRQTHPFVTQLVVVFLVVLGYASIAASKPYQCPHVCICSRHMQIRTEW